MIWDLLYALGISYSLVIVGLASIIVGSLSGFLSFFFVNNRRSILGDTIAHSTLAGVALAYLLSGQKSIPLFFMGALVTALLSVGFFRTITQTTKLKEETAIGITLSIFFSVGIALLTYIQSMPSSSKAGIVNYIFGNIAFLRREELPLLLAVEVLVISVFALFWKEFKLLMFDRELAEVMGLPVKTLEGIQLVLISVTIVVGIQTIGVVLTAGLLIAPSVAARQWTDSFTHVIILSSLLGSLAGVLGTTTSSQIENVPPGPAVIVYSTLLVVVSLFMGRRHGIVIGWMHRNLFHRKIDHTLVLQEFLRLTGNMEKNRGLTEFEFELSTYPSLTEEMVALLERCGYCKIMKGGRCALTLKGVEELRKAVEGER